MPPHRRVRRRLPSAGRSVPRGTPLVVSIRTPGWTDQDDFVRKFAGASTGRDAPGWSGAPMAAGGTERPGAVQLVLVAALDGLLSA